MLTPTEPKKVKTEEDTERSFQEALNQLEDSLTDTSSTLMKPPATTIVPKKSKNKAKLIMPKVLM